MSTKRRAGEERDDALLQAYHDGELAWLARLRLERRLQRSPRLRQELSLLARMGDELRRLDAATPAPDLWASIAPCLARAEAGRPRAVPSWVSAPLAWRVWPAGAAAAAAIATLTFALLWPDTPERGRVVRWIDGGSRSVMVLDEDPNTTIIWVLDASGEDASRGGMRNEV